MINCDLLKDFFPSKDSLDFEKAEKMLEALYFLQFNEMRIIMLKLYASVFYCKPDETSIEEYKKKWDLIEPDIKEEQNEIFRIFDTHFQELNKKIEKDFAKEIEELEAKEKEYTQQLT